MTVAWEHTDNLILSRKQNADERSALALESAFSQMGGSRTDARMD